MRALESFSQEIVRSVARQVPQAAGFVHGLLAALFLAIGAAQLFAPIELLTPYAAWTADVSPLLVRVMGTAEIALALCLVVPVAPRAAHGAAWGLAVAMTCAASFHFGRGELLSAMGPLCAAWLAAFAAWGRACVAPKSARVHVIPV